MNLMFRKNFREGAKTTTGGSSGVKLTSKANRSQGKRSRDMGYGNNTDADVHYRTHLFFSPNRGASSHDFEGLCFSVCECVFAVNYSLLSSSPTYALSLSLYLYYFVHNFFLPSQQNCFSSQRIFCCRAITFPLFFWVSLSVCVHMYISVYRYVVEKLDHMLLTKTM